MSAATELAQVRMRERELLRTPCARCGHSLGVHHLVGERCKYPQWSHERGPKCKCVAFVDKGPQSETLL